MENEKRFCILGCGRLGGVVARAWKQGLLPGWQLTGAASRIPASAQALARETGCPAYDTAEELLALHPDLLVETAGVDAVKRVALPALSAGIDLAAISVGAFADNELYEKARAAAAQSGAKLLLPSGAVGGFDALRTLALMAEAKGEPLQAEMRSLAGSEPYRTTPLYKEEFAQPGTHTAFAGNAAEAIRLLPHRVNVSVAAALATVGPESLSLTQQAQPGFTGDDHRIAVSMPGCRAEVDIYSETSEIAGWSIVALMRQLNDPVKFF